MSNITIREVKNRRDLAKFIKLPYVIHRNHKEWLPPIRQDEWKVFDKERNHAFTHCDTIQLLAEKNGQLVGRIMGIVNRLYNEQNDERNVRFCFLETYEDKEVFDRLLKEVEAWGKAKGMESIVGPLGFSGKDPQGFLIQGFDDPMTVLVTNHSYRYMIDFMESNGYSKKHDLFQYRYPLKKPLPEVYDKIAERVLERGNYHVQEFTKTRQAKPFILDVFALINDTYGHLYGFAPVTEKEAHEFANRFLPFLDARFIKLILDDMDELVAFVIGMPDMSKGLRISKGKLFPFGFIPVLWSMKTTKQLNLLLGCIKKTDRNRGLDSVLAVKMANAAQQASYNMVDTHCVLESNKPMRAEYERLNAELYKKYRIFAKSL